MSAPQTNVEKQEKRHKPALFGIRASLVFVGVLVAAFLVWIAWNGEEPGDAAIKVDGRTGEATPATE